MTLKNLRYAFYAFAITTMALNIIGRIL